MGDFFSTFQDIFLEMTWLNDLIIYLVSKTSLSPEHFLFDVIVFFIYDVIKIIILLSFMVFTIGFIESSFSKSRIRRIMTRFKGVKSNISAALMGTITPFCSCSSIPLFIAFTSARLPLGTSFSFLISSPMVDMASILVLISVFGFNIAIFYVLIGLFIAVISGLIIEKLHLEDQIREYIYQFDSNLEEDQKVTFKYRLKFAYDRTSLTLRKVVLYIFIGVFIGSFIHNVVPESLISTYLSDSPFSVILAVIFGTLMYADLFSVIPIASALLAKGASIGTVVAFMMSVTTLSLPSLIMLSKVVKKKLLIIFILICTVSIIFVGYLFNIIF